MAFPEEFLLKALPAFRNPRQFFIRPAQKRFFDQLNPQQVNCRAYGKNAEYGKNRMDIPDRGRIVSDAVKYVIPQEPAHCVPMPMDQQNPEGRPGDGVDDSALRYPQVLKNRNDETAVSTASSVLQSVTNQ